MYIFRSIHEIINTIAAARGLLTEMFEKRKMLSFRYSDALALLKDDENRLKLLIEKEVIRQNGNFVELDARFLDFSNCSSKRTRKSTRPSSTRTLPSCTN